MITPKAIAAAMGRFSLLRYFPAGDAGIAALTEMLQEMVTTDEQLDWLSRRVLQLHPEWPGPYEIRAVFCSRYKPKDGVEADSAMAKFEDGIPAEHKQHKAEERQQLVSEDARLQQAVSQAAAKKRMPQLAKRA
jgi:hypothetical protein